MRYGLAHMSGPIFPGHSVMHVMLDGGSGLMRSSRVPCVYDVRISQPADRDAAPITFAQSCH